MSKQPIEYFIGIDNGLNGGVAALTADGVLWDARPMPVRKTGKGNLIHAKELMNAIMHKTFGPTRAIAIELPEKHSKGLLSLCSTHQSFGVCSACVELSYPDELIRYVHAREWQKKFWTQKKGQKINTKEAALYHCDLRFPQHSAYSLYGKKRVPHDGIIDAILIAEWLRLQYISENNSTQKNQ